MSNDKNNQFHGEILTPEIARKQIIEIGKTNRVPPEVGIFDEPVRCFKINHEWWSIVAGQVHWLADVSAWQEAEDESYPPILEILRFMQGVECADGSEPMLRQKPDNSCVLQQSLDDGETWSDVFDFSLCLTIQDGSSQTNIINNFYNTSFQTFQNNVYNNYVNNYIDSVTDVHPELGYGDSDDGFRDNALCYALGKLIDSVCLAANEYFDHQAEVGNDLKNSLILAGAIIGIIALAASGVGTPAAAVLATQAGLWAAGIGLGSALGSLLYDHYLDTNQAAYNDAAAKEEVVCCLLDALQGANADHADLIAAFACGSLSANGQAIHDAAAILVQELAMYAAFIENMAIGFQSAKLGLLPSCPCELVTTYRHFVYDFTTQGQGTSVLDIDPEGEFVSGEGWRGTIQSGSVKRIKVKIPHDPSRVIHGVALTVERIGGTGGAGNSRGFGLRPTADSNSGIILNPNLSGNLANGISRYCSNFPTAVSFTGINQLFLSAGVEAPSTAGIEIYIRSYEMVYSYAAGPGEPTEIKDMCLL